MNLGIIRVLVASTPAGIPGSRVQTAPENWHSVFPHLQYVAVKLATITSLHVSYNSTLTLYRSRHSTIYAKTRHTKSMVKYTKTSVQSSPHQKAVFEFKS